MSNAQQWPFRIALVIGILSVIPWIWYFLFLRIHELSDAGVPEKQVGVANRIKFLAEAKDRNVRDLATPLLVTGENLEKLRADRANATARVRELLESYPEAMKDAVIRYHLGGLRRELTGVDLERYRNAKK